MSKKHDEGLDLRLEALLVDARASGSRTSDNKLTRATAALVKELWDPGVGTLHTLVADGRIVSAGPLPISMTIEPEDLEWLRVDYDERDSLCIELAVAGLPTFLHAAVDEKVWTPGRASLLTYFVNACLMHKLRVVNAWTKPRRITRRLEKLAYTDDLDALTLDLSNIPYARSAAQLLVQHANPRVRNLLGALMSGQTTASAAIAIGISPSTARTHMFKFRKNVVVPLVADGLLDAPEGTLIAEHMAFYEDLFDHRKIQNDLLDEDPGADPDDPITPEYVPAEIFSPEWEPSDVF
ncbi:MULTISPECIES: hypothetical protein [Nocardiaceae]|uniref:hypothetical protein n=1 Tax=Nocardiaceae TaxID=85025 RepID=UPI0011407782|nr:MULTISPECIES: hypothetical protein [Rhodococcus]